MNHKKISNFISRWLFAHLFDQMIIGYFKYLNRKKEKNVY